MGMFLIPEGTPVKVIREGKEWYSENFKEHVTKKTNVFEKHEVTIDPSGRLGIGPQDRVVGGSYARAGWYGFKSEGWNLLVPARKVQYG